MTHHTHVRRAQPQLGADLVGLALRIERQDHDAPLTLGEAFEAAGQAIGVEGRLAAFNRRLQGGAELLEEPLPASGSAPEVGDDPAARPEDEGREAFGLPNLSRAQALERHEDDILGQVVRGRMIAEVPEAVKANSRRKPAVQLRLGSVIAAREALRQLGIARNSGAVGICQRAASIAQASPSNGSVTTGGVVTPPLEEERR